MAGIRIEAKLTGDKAMRRKINKLAKDYPKAFAAALYAAGLFIMGDAVLRTPVDFGPLRGSAFVSRPVQTSRGVVVVLGFGKDYAVFVHERTDVKHTVGEAKFLENALNEKSPGLAKFLADVTLVNIERGVGVVTPSAEFPTEPKT
jgi:hypothetical protein